ncbi:MAG: thioredoxin-dependent thiol peroxidase [Rhodovulum sulfidophilum]|uniref:thioredoxin-dependent peroxiredoxin n=1 Tax=Rhodovulum sulfidophilum TaxID=35806 RepID=A0A2W5QBI0_RHOSU|nr:MAG: thioredoxin-dependent thiol peroxidase [Rhodovulum sulfidophilum]
MPDTGDIAPAFTLPRDGGGQVSLADFAGKPVVVYFYPRDDTPGCTTEASDFTAEAAAFAALDVAVIGVSKDTVKSHDKFRDKHALAVILASDADGDTAERFGVWGEKSMYGKTFLGIERATFLIGPDGRIARVWRKVKVAGHAAEVLAAARAL